MSIKASKCIHVLATPDYAPDLCAITLPTIRAYAARIGADFNLITTRKFPDYPINYERLQIYEAGINYDWNLSIDADMVIGKALPDITTDESRHLVRVVMVFEASRYLEVSNDIYFQRDGRDVGIVDAFVLTSKSTHDLWEPLPGRFHQYAHLYKDGNTRRISEYCLSKNLAKYGLQYTGAFQRSDQIFHVNYTSGNPQDALSVAKAKASDWGW